MRAAIPSRGGAPRSSAAILGAAWRGALRSPSIATLAVALASCSLSVPSPDACASSDECRGVFGAGFYCDAGRGRCESVVRGGVCPELFPADIASDRDAIVFGTIINRASPNQLVRERAMRLAVAGLNERAGLDGRRVGLLHCTLPATAAAAYLIDEVGVAAIVGPSSSSDTEAVFSSHREDGVLVISPAATATQLVEIDRPDEGPGLLWRTAPPDQLQAQVIAGQLGVVTASVITRQNDTYAQGLSVSLQEQATEVTFAATPQFARADQIATAAMAALGTGAPPDVVVFISSQVTDAARFLDEAAAIAAYDGVSIVLTDAAANDELLSLTATTPGAARYDAVRATRPSTPDTIITSEFVGAYQAAFDGEDPLAFSFTAHSYDAMAMVLIGAGVSLAAEGAVTGPGIAAALTRLSSGTARQLLSANFNAIIGELRGGASVDLVGASGELDYDPITEELTQANYDVLSIRGAGADAELVVDATVSAE